MVHLCADCGRLRRRLCLQWPPPFPPDVEALALCRQQTAVLRAWEPEEHALVLGRGSRFEEEVDMAAWQANPLPVYRRLGGGCTVLMGPGMVAILYCRRGARPAYPVDWLRSAAAAIGDRLAAMGVRGIAVQANGDLTWAGRKLMGTTLYVGKDTLLFGASLLVTNPLEPICRYLRHPPREPEYRRGRSHAHFLARLADVHPGLTAPALADTLARELPGRPGSPFTL